MGQKVNPTGLRIGVIKDWNSRWFVKDSEFGDTLDCLVVVDLQVMFAIALNHLYLIVLGVLEHPKSNQLTVTHV